MMVDILNEYNLRPTTAGNQEDRIALWSRILGIADVDTWPDYWTLGEKELEQVI